MTNDHVNEWVQQKLADRDKWLRWRPQTTCVLWDVAETVAALQERVRALEAENARLNKALNEVDDTIMYLSDMGGVD